MSLEDWFGHIELILAPRAAINHWPDVITSSSVVRTEIRWIKNCEQATKSPKNFQWYFGGGRGDLWNPQSSGIPQLKKWACRLNRLSSKRMDWRESGEVTNKCIRDAGSTADFRILLKILKFKNLEIWKIWKFWKFWNIWKILEHLENLEKF